MGEECPYSSSHHRVLQKLSGHHSGTDEDAKKRKKVGNERPLLSLLQMLDSHQNRRLSDLSRLQECLPQKLHCNIILVTVHVYKRQTTLFSRCQLIHHLIISLHFSTIKSLNLLLSFRMAFCISFFSFSLCRILLYFMYFSYRISYSLVISSLICCCPILLCSSILIISYSFIDLFCISC